MGVAIIGMACRFPGCANIEEYWQLLMEKRSAIQELPDERINLDLYYRSMKGQLGRSFTKIGGVVQDLPWTAIDYPIHEDLVKNVDPSHITMLGVAIDAIHHAKIHPSALTGQNIGVYIGHSRGSDLAADLTYGTRIEELAQELANIQTFGNWTAKLRSQITKDIVDKVRENTACRSTHRNPDVTANGIARLITQVLNLRGPYQAVDAACASGLYALSVAVDSILGGRIDMAITGAGSYSSWMSLVLFSQAQALSAKGSFPFDSRADGFVSSDGYGALVLKSLERAVADGDNILAVIQGVGLSSDGRGRSLWAPKKEGQILAIKRAYPKHINPLQLQYIEAHGTSTQLGDATEFDSVTSFLTEIGVSHAIPIASVKANIGHTCEAAGIAGLIKTVLALSKKIIPPSINFEHPNPQIDWEKSPLFVPTESLEWISANGVPRVAAVNSFGIGGLNAHVVLEEYPTASEPRSLAKPNRQTAGSTAEAIAIIGVGAVFPGANSIQAFRELIQSKRNAKSVVSSKRWNPLFCSGTSSRGAFIPTKTGGFIHDFIYDWRNHKIPPKQMETADPLRFMLLDAADQALKEAGYDTKEFDHQRTAVIVGTLLANNDFFSDLSLALKLPHFENQLTKLLTESGCSTEESAEILSEFRTSFFNN
jgi:acyl transferase domain-containing protein